MYTTIALTGGSSSSVRALPSRLIFTIRASRPSGERCCSSGISRPARLNWNACDVESCKPPPASRHDPDQRRKSRDGPHRRAALIAALHAVVQPDRRGTCGRVVSRQLHDVSAAMPVSAATRSGGYSSDALAQRIETVGVSVDVIGVVQFFADDHVHQAQRQRQIAARVDGEVLVGQRRRARADGIDHHQLRAVAPRLHDERPQVNVRAVRCWRPRR